MSNTVPMASRVSPFLVAIILITLLLSLVSIWLGINEYMIGDPAKMGSIYVIMGGVTLMLSSYMLFQTKRRLFRIGSIEPQPLSTTLQCQKCGFKNIREFQRGDYIFKQTEQPCPKDNEKMVISAIYREVKEKEKAKEEGST